MATPRMRTATGVMAEIKAQDPDTEVTLHYIRYLIKENLVPVVCVGTKKLVNVDLLIERLASGEIEAAQQKQQYGQIRRVQV